MNLCKLITFLAIYLSFIIANHCALSSEESYASSTFSLTKLLETENKLIQNLERYATELRQKQKFLEELIRSRMEKRLLMKADIHNPIKQFSFIRYLGKDVRAWIPYISKSQGKEQDYIEVAAKMDSLLPTSKDLTDACNGIDGLITYYNLKLENLVTGKLPKQQKLKTGFSALDCYALGKCALFNHNYERARAWLNASSNNFIEGKPEYKIHQFKKDNIFKLLHRIGKMPYNKQYAKFQEWLLVKNQCAADLIRPTNLHCRHLTTTPFTIVAPLKIEELSHNPYMVFYHDVIYKSEIDWILRSKSNKNGSNDKVTKVLQWRLVDITGMSMEMSHNIHLITSGIGQNQIDFQYHSHGVKLNYGDRLASVLLYLSNIDLGGATIFPKLNLTITPQKGSALFWHNFQNSGVVNKKSGHLMCPVIVGSKLSH